MKIVLIVTGHRDCDHALVWKELDRYRIYPHGDMAKHLYLILGDESHGADAAALAWARYWGIEHKVHFNDGNWPSAGPRRNSKMVAQGVERRSAGDDVRFVAFWQGKRERSGTNDCMAQCVAAKIRGEVVPA